MIRVKEPLSERGARAGAEAVRLAKAAMMVVLMNILISGLVQAYGVEKIMGFVGESYIYWLVTDRWTLHPAPFILKIILN